MDKFAWIFWLGLVFYYGYIAVASVRSLRSISKEVSTLSTEGGLMLTRKRELELQGEKPLNLGTFIMTQLKNLQWSSSIAAVGAIIAVVISVLLSI